MAWFARFSASRLCNPLSFLMTCSRLRATISDAPDEPVQADAEEPSPEEKKPKKSAKKTPAKSAKTKAKADDPG